VSVLAHDIDSNDAGHDSEDCAGLYSQTPIWLDRSRSDTRDWTESIWHQGCEQSVLAKRVGPCIHSMALVSLYE
jgi:hypothetical protein